MQIFSALFIVIFPLRSKRLFDVYRQHTSENRIACILRRSWQYAVKSFLFGYAETFRKDRLYCFPLVKTEIINQYKKQWCSFFYMRQYFKTEHVMAHDGTVFTFRAYP